MYLSVEFLKEQEVDGTHFFVPLFQNFASQSTSCGTVSVNRVFAPPFCAAFVELIVCGGSHAVIFHLCDQSALEGDMLCPLPLGPDPTIRICVSVMTTGSPLSSFILAFLPYKPLKLPNFFHISRLLYRFCCSYDTHCIEHESHCWCGHRASATEPLFLYVAISSARNCHKATCGLQRCFCGTRSFGFVNSQCLLRDPGKMFCDVERNIAEDSAFLDLDHVFTRR